MTTHMPRNDAAASSHVCPGIRIHAIDIVQPPGIGIPPVAAMDVPHAIVTAALAPKSSAKTPRKPCWEPRSDARRAGFSDPAVTAMCTTVASASVAAALDRLTQKNEAAIDDARPLGRRGVVVLVVPVPPLVRRGLRVALRRVLPVLLASECRDVEIVPGTAHLLVAAVVDEVGAEHLFAVADEGVRAVPLVHAEIFVEAVGDAVPGRLPVHSCLQALDVRQRGARDERERGVARVQMSEVRDLIGHKGAAAARMFGPPVHAG